MIMNKHKYGNIIFENERRPSSTSRKRHPLQMRLCEAIGNGF